MPARLRAILGDNATPRVIIVERSDAIAPDMGTDPRPVIEDALRKLGVETRLGVGVAALDASGVTLANGERIQSATVIWTAGLRAAPLTAQIPAERDKLGRLIVERDLRVRRCLASLPPGMRQGGNRRDRQLCTDVVSARDADGRVCRQQWSGRAAGRAEQAVSPGGLRHLSGPRRGRRDIHAGMGAEPLSWSAPRPSRPSRRSTRWRYTRRVRSVPRRSLPPIRSKSPRCRRPRMIHLAATKLELTAMHRDTVRMTAFAMPLTNPASPPGAYRFINREYFIVQYRTDPQALHRLGTCWPGCRTPQGTIQRSGRLPIGSAIAPAHRPSDLPVQSLRRPFQGLRARAGSNAPALAERSRRYAPHAGGPKVPGPAAAGPMVPGPPPPDLGIVTHDIHRRED